MANLSPSPSPPFPFPAAAAAAVTKRPLRWPHQETIHLIQAFQEKWFSLKRRVLKTEDWEEVAATVAVRCGYNYTDPSKTSAQCRHKIENLRRRFGKEKRLLAMAGGGACDWPYYALMYVLEHSPYPLSVLPMAPEHPKSNKVDREDDDDGDNEEESENEERGNFSKLRSIDYILQRPKIVNRFAGEKNLSNGGKGFSGFVPEEAVKRQKVAEDRVLVMAAEIRAFTDMVVGIEKMKMEMMRETERLRMEMENKRLEMILRSEMKIVETIGTAIGCMKFKMDG